MYQNRSIIPPEEEMNPPGVIMSEPVADPNLYLGDLRTCKTCCLRTTHANFKRVDFGFETPDIQISFSSTKSKLPLEFLRGSWLDHWISLPVSMSATLGDWKLRKQANWISDSDVFMFRSLTKLYWWMISYFEIWSLLSAGVVVFLETEISLIWANVNAGLHFETNIQSWSCTHIQQL